MKHMLTCKAVTTVELVPGCDALPGCMKMVVWTVAWCNSDSSHHASQGTCLSGSCLEGSGLGRQHAQPSTSSLVCTGTHTIAAWMCGSVYQCRPSPC